MELISKSFGRWRQALKSPRFVCDFILTLIITVGAILFSEFFYNWVEVRAGVVISDPFLALFAARDVTDFTFFLIYVAVLSTLYQLFLVPQSFLDGLQSYLLLVGFRILMMWSMPLEAPVGIIPLKDPVVDWIVHSHVLQKDLFFSGHTSTCFLMALLSSRFKPMYFLATFLVASSVLLQHVHYLADVLVAPFVAYTSYKIVYYFKNRRFYPS